MMFLGQGSWGGRGGGWTSLGRVRACRGRVEAGSGVGRGGVGVDHKNNSLRKGQREGADIALTGAALIGDTAEEEEEEEL